MKNTNSILHRKAETLLRTKGWTPMRQFEPIKADAIGKGEHFEMWSAPGAKDIVIVHFYGDENGAEFYFKGTKTNTWHEVEQVLTRS